MDPARGKPGCFKAAIKQRDSIVWPPASPSRGRYQQNVPPLQVFRHVINVLETGEGRQTKFARGNE